MKKIILTIATAMISVFAMAQESQSLPTFIFTGSSPSSPYILEIRFYDQFAEQVIKENVEFPLNNVFDENPVPYQIATINLLSYVNEEWVIAEHLFHYEPTRKVKNGGQLSQEYIAVTHQSLGGYSTVHPRDYDKTWLLLKDIYIFGYFTTDGNVDLHKQIDCEFIMSTTGQPSRDILRTTFSGYIFKLDDNGNTIL